MPDCKQRFDTDGEGTADSLKTAMDLAGTKAAERAINSCKLNWDCKEVADYGVKSVSIEQIGGNWNVKYTGTFSCEETPAAVTAAQQAKPMCGKEFTVKGIAPNANVAETRAGSMAKIICGQLEDCKKTIRVSGNATSVGNTFTYTGTYKCVQEDTGTTGTETVVPR